MDDVKPAGKETIEGIEIDYDHFDVASIMTQVKRAAARRPVEPLEAKPEPPAAPPAAPEPPAPAPSVPPPSKPGLKEIVKLKLSRAIRPFAPVIRLLGLPLHEEILASWAEIGRISRRQDELSDRLDRALEKIDRRFSDSAADLDRLRDWLDVRLVDLDRSMEYIKLLHNLDHNLVVELTKLRIEFETLKSRARILEKDLEAQTRRERVLEKRLGS